MAKKIFDNSGPPNLQGFRNLEGFLNKIGFAPLCSGMCQREFCREAKQKSWQNRVEKWDFVSSAVEILVWEKLKDFSVDYHFGDFVGAEEIWYLGDVVQRFCYYDIS